MGEAARVAPEQPAAAPRRGSRLRRVVAFSSLSYLVFVVVLGVVLRLADRWWPATLLMFAPGWLLVLPVAVLIPAAVFVRRRSLGPLVLALLIGGSVTNFSPPWVLLSRPTEGTRLRLLTCNLHYADDLDQDPLNRLIAETQPDVIVLQEWDHPNSSEALVLPGGGWHTHQTPQQHLGPKLITGRFVLASRFPIRQTTFVGRDSMSAQGAVVRYELETPAGLVTVFNLHLATPREGLEAAFRASGEGPAKIQVGSSLRREQSESVAREANRVAGPVLIAGDINTPPQSVLFRQTWAGYSDAFSSAGCGWGYTFFTRTAAVRIDHILAGPGWRCGRCWVGPDVGSPHRPLLADLVYSPAQGR